MKMLFAVCLFALCSCASLQPGCVLEKQGSQIVSSVLVAKLQCANAPAVQSDVLAMFEKMNICPVAKQGPIADTLCPAVSQFAAQFASNLVPSNWQCSSLDAKAALQAAILNACTKIPFKPAK